MIPALLAALDKGRAVQQANSASRVNDYAELKSWGVSRADAASRLGVTIRTIERYEKRLRQVTPC